MKAFFFLLLSCHIFWVTKGQKQYKICTTGGFTEQCEQIKRDSPNMRCVQVQDSIECANLLRNGSSGFGIFSAETTLLLAALDYDGLTALKELRHSERLNYSSDFESVVVVKASHKRGIEGLKGLNYCHPGLRYDHSERWSERFLKHFERIITTPICDKDITSPAEIEVAALADVFKTACRPGLWSNNLEEDARLKSKYSQLCELCPATSSPCEYSGKNRHNEALRCLLNKGDVAYVSRWEAEDFFSPSSGFAHLRNEYAYLCPDGRIQLIADNPKDVCSWLRQPWSHVISSGGDSVELSEGINRWIYSSGGWEKAVRDILMANSLTPVKTDIQKPRDIFFRYREVPFSQPLCSTEVSWCTKSLEEKEKCDLVRTAGITTGVYPLIKCPEYVAGANICLKEVYERYADFTSIDANLGYIARNQYNLTTALYTETNEHASIVIVVRANIESKLASFEDLRNKKACIPEFNGIASLAFINAGKEIGFLPQKNCNHSRLLGEFFGSSCIPGAHDPEHGNFEKRNNLCSLCQPMGTNAMSAVHTSNDQVEIINTGNIQSEIEALNNDTPLNCKADSSNSFFGNRGALFCLAHKGDVAILGLNDLNEHAKALALDPRSFQIICRNGSLADRTGFDVEPDCAIGNFVDGEIVIKPHNQKREGIINALISLDKYFKIDPEFKIYQPFNGHKDLLFKNATVGLEAYDEPDLGVGVENYKKLFENLNTCGSGSHIIPAAAVVIATAIFSFIRQ